jgi:hypothetical protein
MVTWQGGEGVVRRRSQGKGAESRPAAVLSFFCVCGFVFVLPFCFLLPHQLTDSEVFAATKQSRN